MTVNANIFADFQKLSDSVQSAFLNKQAVVVLLPVGTKLFKLSDGEIKAHPQYGVTA